MSFQPRIKDTPSKVFSYLEVNVVEGLSVMKSSERRMLRCHLQSCASIPVALHTVHGQKPLNCWILWQEAKYNPMFTVSVHLTCETFSFRKCLKYESPCCLLNLYIWWNWCLTQRQAKATITACQSGQWQLSRRLFEDMIQLQVVPSLITLNAMISFLLSFVWFFQVF